MPGRSQRSQRWDDEDVYGEDSAYGSQDDDRYGGLDAGDGREEYYDGDDGDDERGLVLQSEHSLVGVSNTVTHHGVPLLSYTRTMNRFYTNRKQRLSLGRFKCEVCGERIRFWAWQTTTGTRTHDGCYERLAWTWTSLYAQQQRLAAEGRLD
ncbi:MAG TPA: hypothetical protein VJN88_07540 [Ktedonobacterales bacterium]|nr:hypothetical protein [Ktedonobacterales bacterium]